MFSFKEFYLFLFIDDDECTLGTDNCRTLGSMWQCRNTYGSFRCVRKRCDGKEVLVNGECKPMECPVGYDSPQHGQCNGNCIAYMKISDNNYNNKIPIRICAYKYIYLVPAQILIQGI